MLSGADLSNLSLDFSRQAGLGQTLTLTINETGTTETATGSGASAAPAVILSMSPAAKASLAQHKDGASDDEIALALFGAKIRTPLQQPTAKSVSTTSAAGSNGAADTPATFATKLAKAQQMSPTDRFYAMTDETQAEAMATTLSPEQQAQFLAAFKAKTLTIQDSADVPGLDFSETTTAVGTAIGVGGSTTCSYNSAVPEQFYPGGSLLFATPVLGCSVVTWPSSKTSNANTANTLTVASS